MARDDRTHLSEDREEARLLAILATCKERAAVARNALSYPTRSRLMPEVKKLQDDLDMARAERQNAMNALREYRERKSGQSAAD